MDKLATHDAFTIFYKSGPAKPDEWSEYYENMSNPTCLATIRHRLEKDAYHAASDWKSAVASIWLDIEKRYKNSSPIRHVGAYLREVFGSLSSGISGNEIDDWNAELSLLKSELEELGSSIPQELPIPKETGFVSFPYQLKQASKQSMGKAPKMTLSNCGLHGNKMEKEEAESENLWDLVQCLNSLQKSEDIERVFQVVKRHHNDFIAGDHVEIALEMLPPEAISELRGIALRVMNRTAS
jgi:hypothetical protein